MGKDQQQNERRHQLPDPKFLLGFPSADDNFWVGKDHLDFKHGICYMHPRNQTDTSLQHPLPPNLYLTPGSYSDCLPGHHPHSVLVSGPCFALDLNPDKSWGPCCLPSGFPEVASPDSLLLVPLTCSQPLPHPSPLGTHGQCLAIPLGPRTPLNLSQCTCSWISFPRIHHPYASFIIELALSRLSSWRR